MLVPHEAGEQREGKPEALKPRAGGLVSRSASEPDSASLDLFHTFCSPLLLRPERRHQHRAANVRERPSVALRIGPLFDISGSVLAVWVSAQATVHRNY